MPGYEPVEPQTPDHYFNLGLTQYASSADIKKAFFKLAKLHHPDKKTHDESGDAAEFIKAHHAFEVLRYPSKRAAYDMKYYQVRVEWLTYRSAYADHKRQEEQERLEDEKRHAHIREQHEQKAEERRLLAEEFVRIRAQRETLRREREERERLAQERSRKVADRAREARQQAAEERLRKMAEEEARIKAHDQARQWEREHKERLAEERSRKVADRAHEARQKAAGERLRIMKEAEERARQLRFAKLQQEAEERSAQVAEQARIQQEKRAQQRLAEIEAANHLAELHAQQKLAQELEWDKLIEARRKQFLADMAKHKRAMEAEQRRQESITKQLEESEDEREVRHHLHLDKEPYTLPDISAIPTYYLADRQRRIRKARLWVHKLHAVHAAKQGLVTTTTAPQVVACVDLAWPKERGTATCDFCDRIVTLYLFCCPLGGAAACADCMYKVARGFEIVSGEVVGKRRRGEEKKGGKKGRGKGKGKK